MRKYPTQGIRLHKTQNNIYENILLIMKILENLNLVLIFATKSYLILFYLDFIYNFYLILNDCENHLT